MTADERRALRELAARTRAEAVVIRERSLRLPRGIGYRQDEILDIIKRKLIPVTEQ